MLADGVEGLGQFVAALVQAVTAGLGVRLTIPCGTGNGGFERWQQVIRFWSGLAQTVTAIDQQAAGAAQEGGHAQVCAAIGLDCVLKRS